MYPNAFARKLKATLCLFQIHQMNKADISLPPEKWKELEEAERGPKEEALHFWTLFLSLFLLWDVYQKHKHKYTKNIGTVTVTASHSFTKKLEQHNIPYASYIYVAPLHTSYQFASKVCVTQTFYVCVNVLFISVYICVYIWLNRFYIEPFACKLYTVHITCTLCQRIKLWISIEFHEC